MSWLFVVYLVGIIVAIGVDLWKLEDPVPWDYTRAFMLSMAWPFFAAMFLMFAIPFSIRWVLKSIRKFINEVLEKKA